MTEELSTYKIITGIISFNQENFIAKTIQGVLDQKISFSHHIVIFDDSSSDNTPEIIRSFQKNYPDRISIYLRDKNISVGNLVYEFYKTVKNKSKYLTVVEGDDYWNYSLKLQNQVDFLESNKDYNGCFHDAIIHSFNEKEGVPLLAKIQTHGNFRTYSQFNRYAPDFYAWDLFQRNLIPTSSLVFRNLDFEKFTFEFKKIKLSLNWAFHLALLSQSKFRYINETWSVYNDHPEGFSKKFEYNDFKISNVQILKLLYKQKFYSGIDINLNKAIANEYRQIIFNQATKKKSFWFLLKYIIKYFHRTIFVVCIESLYLIKHYFIKSK